MTYQPPLIGTKQLLNFTAASWPDVGTLFLGVAFGLGVAALVVARRRRTSWSYDVDRARCRGVRVQRRGPACDRTTPIDTCAYCRMTISDERFGGQFVTSKGKVHVFDSIECLAAFYLANGTMTDGEQAWVSRLCEARPVGSSRARSVRARRTCARAPWGSTSSASALTRIRRRSVAI